MLFLLYPSCSLLETDKGRKPQYPKVDMLNCLVISETDRAGVCRLDLELRPVLKTHCTSIRRRRLRRGFSPRTPSSRIGM